MRIEGKTYNRQNTNSHKKYRLENNGVLEYNDQTIWLKFNKEQKKGLRNDNTPYSDPH